MPDLPCPAVAQYGDHLYGTVYYRVWYHLWRKRYRMVCHVCNLEINEP